MSKAKIEEKAQAQELRRKGMAIKQIAKTLGVSVGSAHLWVKDIPVDRETKIRLAQQCHQANRLAVSDKRDQRLLTARKEAESEWVRLRESPEFMFGLALYLGEGYKKEGRVGVTSSEPALLRMSLRFFALIGCDMQRVRAGVHLHQGEDPAKALTYWSSELGLPESKFEKVVASKVSGGTRARHLVHGTGLVRVSHTAVKWKLNRWMELAREQMGVLQENEILRA